MREYQAQQRLIVMGHREFVPHRRRGTNSRVPEPRRRRRPPTMGGARLQTDRAAAGAAVQRLAGAKALPGAGCGSRARRDTVASCISCSVSPAHYHVSESWPVVRAGHRRGAREGSTLRAKRGAWLPTAPAASRSRFARRLGGSSDLFFGVEPTTESGSSWRRNYERHRRMSWPTRMSRPRRITSPRLPFSSARLAASWCHTIAARLDGPAVLGFVQARREDAIGASWAP